MGRFFLIVSACMAALLTGPIVPAAAQSDSEHKSFLRIGASERLPQVRQIKMGLNKSMVVELPRDAREVMVSNPQMIDAVLQTAKRVYLIGLERGEVNVIFTDSDGRQFLTLEVAVERDLVAIKRLLDRLIPGSDIHIEAINEAVVLTGTVRDPADASRAAKVVASFLSEDGTVVAGEDPTPKVINMISVLGQEQVLLRVSVVEMERSTIKQLGVDVGAVGNALVAAPFTGLVNPAEPLLALTPNLGARTANPFPFGVAPPNTVSAFFTTNGNTIGGVVRALEQQNLARTLAEPNLTAISGETANFLAGGEFPIVTAFDAQTNTPTVEFKPFGVGLAFTPLVLSEGRISLKLETEVSELSPEGAISLGAISVPALKVRRASSTLELPSGGSLVLAGLISEQSKQAMSGYPGLKNLPVLGTLFRSRDFQKNETELVIIVTPFIVDAVARNDLVQPDKGFSWASDVHADFLGQVNRIYGKDPERKPMGECCGDVGFIVE